MAMTPSTPQRLPHVAIAQFACGMAYPLRALAYMRMHRLWRLALMPVGINAVLLLGLGVTLWYHLWPALNALQLSLQNVVHVGPEYSETLRVVLGIASFLVWLVLLPIVLVLCAMLLILFGQMFCAPWLDLLAERVECQQLGEARTAFSFRRLVDALFLSMGDAVWGLFYLVLVYIPVLLFALLPGVGAVVSVACGALFLAQQFLGHTLSRASLSYRGRWQAVLANKWFCLGFGTVALVMVSLPGLNLALLPVATVGGTLLCCDLIRDGRISSVSQAALCTAPRGAA